MSAERPDRPTRHIRRGDHHRGDHHHRHDTTTADDTLRIHDIEELQMAKLRSLFGRKDDTTELEGPLTADSIRQWLIERLARQVKVAPEEVDTSRTFEEYGLDSRVAVQVSGALEKIVERRLSPGLLYEHSTIDDLSAYLARELDLVDPV